jgi:hypothetical protein
MVIDSNVAYKKVFLMMYTFCHVKYMCLEAENKSNAATLSIQR